LKTECSPHQFADYPDYATSKTEKTKNIRHPQIIEEGLLREEKAFPKIAPFQSKPPPAANAQFIVSASFNIDYCCI
jgi:hypothetical protein